MPTSPSELADRVTLADLEGDPHPVLAGLRATGPAAWVPVLGAWLVTGYDVAVAVLRDTRTFTVDDPLLHRPGGRAQHALAGRHAAHAPPGPVQPRLPAP